MPGCHLELRSVLDRGCERCGDRVKVFFRADDVGVPSRNFTRLLGLFAEHRMPLADACSELWCWHQHGWRHVNHEPVGKKSEFGQGRTHGEIRSDLKRGQTRLKEILGSCFCPVFTPPWNRCDRRTLGTLDEMGFLAVSRSAGGLPESPKGLPDLCVHIDLHTRKGMGPATDRALLFHEIEQAFTRGRCGIMLHHRRMNGSAFEFLDVLLNILSTHPRVERVGFREMV